MPHWVDFKDVPDHLFSHKGLNFLASIIGSFKKTASNTERCTRLDMTRVLIGVNLEKLLPDKICIKEKEGSDVLIP